MPNYQALSSEVHANKRFLRSTTYAFAATDAITPLVASELPKAVMSLPVGFLQQGESYLPVAILGVQTGKNLFVAQNGRWAGQYIPSSFRSYPFKLANTEDGQQVLCVDEDSGLIVEDTSTQGSSAVGEALFDAEGKPVQAVMDVLNFLNLTEQSRLRTIVACAALQKHQLIRPWSITLKTESGEQQIAGLFQVDEAALNQLSGEAMLEVREAGGLLIAYCQLLSMQHLPVLGELLAAHAKVVAEMLKSQVAKPAANAGFSLADNTDTISFGNL